MADLAHVEETLLARAQGGERAAIDLLLEAHRSRVTSVVRGVVLDPDEADDVTQEVLSLVARKLHLFDGRSSFATWVYRIAVNRAVGHRRAPRFRFRWLGIEHAEGTPAPETTLPDPEIARALGELDPSDRAVLALYYWEEQSVDEIASALGVGVSAAKMRIHRARERFRAAYGEVA